MGIPYLFRSLLARNPQFQQVMLERVPTAVTSLSIDVNSLVHTAFQAVYGYGDYEDPIRAQNNTNVDPAELRKQVCFLTLSMLDGIWNVFRPSQVLIVAVDGVCPMAKIQQQRRRRYMSGSDRNPESLHDTNEISPGTDFMVLLDKYIDSWIHTRSSQFKTSTLIYSSHLSYGEGEHKIFQYFRDGTIPQQDGASHVIYGMDSDFILISLISDIKGLYLSRDSVKFELRDRNKNQYNKKKKEQFKSGPSGPHVQIQGPRIPRNNKIMSIDILRSTLVEFYGRQDGLADFAFSIGFLGNDFIPATPSLRTSEATVDLLLTLGKQHGPLVYKDQNGYGIRPQNLINFLTALQQNEAQRLAEDAELVQRSQFPSRFYAYATQQGGFNSSMFRDIWYSNATGPRNLQLMYGLGLRFEPEPSRVNQMCEQLIRGMCWTLNYYTRNPREITWLWYYPFFHAPLLGELVAVSDKLSRIGVEAPSGQISGLQLISDTRPEESEVRFGLMHQIVSIIPPTSLNVVPQFLQQFYQDSSSIQDLMPLKFELESDGVTEKRHSIAIVPPVDYKRLMLALEDVRVPAKDEAKWKRSHPDLVKTLTPSEIANIQQNVQISTVSRGVQNLQVSQPQQSQQTQQRRPRGTGATVRLNYT